MVGLNERVKMEGYTGYAYCITLCLQRDFQSTNGGGRRAACVGIYADIVKPGRTSTAAN
jgi:hypothetical protein